LKLVDSTLSAILVQTSLFKVAKSATLDLVRVTTSDISGVGGNTLLTASEASIVFDNSTI
jgi:hypothetical protein